MGGISSEVAFLSRAPKMLPIRQVAPDMAKTARAEGWDPLELLVKVLAEEVTARENTRRREPHPRGPIPPNQDPLRFRLRPPTISVTSPDRAPASTRLRPRSPQRDLPGPGM